MTGSVSSVVLADSAGGQGMSNDLKFKRVAGALALVGSALFHGAGGAAATDTPPGTEKVEKFIKGWNANKEANWVDTCKVYFANEEDKICEEIDKQQLSDMEKTEKAYEYEMKQEADGEARTLYCKENPSECDCFLTTACCRTLGLADDCYELSTLRHFRDAVLARQPGGASVIAEYYRIAPDICRSLEGDRPALLALYFRYILPCAVMHSFGCDRLVRTHYTGMMRRLEARYATA